MSYFHTVGEVGAAAWEITASSTGSAGAGGIDGNRVPWLREEGLAQARDEELWPPLIFAMRPNWMEEGFAYTYGFLKGIWCFAGKVQVFVGGKNDLCRRVGLLFMEYRGCEGFEWNVKGLERWRIKNGVGSQVLGTASSRSHVWEIGVCRKSGRVANYRNPC